MVKRMILLASVIVSMGSSLAPAAQIGLLDGRVSVSSSAGMNLTDDFTLEAWIFPTMFYFDGNVDSSYQSIVYKWVGGTNQRSYLLAVYQDQLELAISTDGTSPNTPGVYSNAHLALNQWAHVAGVYEDGTMTLYINGQKDTASAFVSSAAFAGQAPVYIGGTQSATYQRFDGGIDEVRISDSARYDTSFAVPTTEFAPDSSTMLLMHLNEGTGTATANLGLLGGNGILDTNSSWGGGAPIVPAPEPATLSLLALGGLAIVRQRKVK